MNTKSEIKIALITPLRDEISNIETLFNSIENQSINIDTWIIVENGSTDGSIEKLINTPTPTNVKKLIVLNKSFQNNEYALGSKYSQVVSCGFEEAKKQDNYEEFTHIGILDADCFPKSDYYKKLVDFLSTDKSIGITSGIIYEESGKVDSASTNWVRGGCRLWSFECFRKSGYLIGPSADALSSAKAFVNGWKSVVCSTAKVTSREVGARTNYQYYGKATYYRGISPIYATLRGVYLLKRSYKVSLQYLTGYYGDFFSRAPRVQDEDILNFYKNYGFRKLKELVTRKKSQCH
ncbi:glycosyltransferase family A protein [Pseudomonas sp. A-R-19]|uniref:glycosyltransferase family A protein n=1 Tax=Pseudomonas sp. A-R-19 TaxID=2832403 RepID=UPI001CBF3A25|nr:glycosyltransferase family A protein [Pseudomonas sp. A-R-19]